MEGVAGPSMGGPVGLVRRIRIDAPRGWWHSIRDQQRKRGAADEVTGECLDSPGSSGLSRVIGDNPMIVQTDSGKAW